MTVRLLVGDALERLRTLPDGAARCCVTSPPYWRLRDYGDPRQIGLEETLEEWLERLRAVFAEVRRVLTPDGTLWVNIGDAYASEGTRQGNTGHAVRGSGGTLTGYIPRPAGFKLKDLMLLPARLAMTLQADGWYLRSDIIWAKPNPMPESVTDRPTKSHEYLYLLSKAARYYYDADAIAEPALTAHEVRYVGTLGSIRQGETNAGRGESTRRFGRSGNTVRRPATERGVPTNGNGTPTNGELAGSVPWSGVMRNKRDVWTVNTAPFPEAHFATFPPALIEPCILAGSAPGDTVLDPFGGAGTTGLVADRLGRNAILLELIPAYADMAERRIHTDNPMFTQVMRCP